MSSCIVFHFLIKNPILSHEISESGDFIWSISGYFAMCEMLSGRTFKGKVIRIAVLVQGKSWKFCTATPMRPRRHQAYKLWHRTIHFEKNTTLSLKKGRKYGQSLYLKKLVFQMGTNYCNHYIWRSWCRWECWWRKGDDNEEELVSFIKLVFKCDGD